MWGRWSLSWCGFKQKHQKNCERSPLHNVYILEYLFLRAQQAGTYLKNFICYTIQHIFVPFCSVRRKMGKDQFSWVSNSKFVIFSQLFLCVIYKIWGKKRQNPANNFDYTPVAILDTGESYYRMCTHIVHWLRGAFDNNPRSNAPLEKKGGVNLYGQPQYKKETWLNRCASELRQEIRMWLVNWGEVGWKRSGGSASYKGEMQGLGVWV